MVRAHGTGYHRRQGRNKQGVLDYLSRPRKAAELVIFLIIGIGIDPRNTLLEAVSIVVHIIIEFVFIVTILGTLKFCLRPSCRLFFLVLFFKELFLD
jgi:hypothetical protein